MIGNNPNHNNDNADQNVPQDAANWASPHASKVLSIPDNPQETNKQINKSNTQLLSIVKAILLAGNGVVSASTPVNNAGQQNNRKSTVSDEPNQKREITMDNLMNQQIPITLNQLLQLLSKNDKKVLAPWTLANFQHPPIDDLAQYIVDIIEQPISKGSQNGIEMHTNNSDEKFFANSRGKGIPGPPNGQQFSLKLKPDKGSLNSYMGDVKSQKISSDSGGMQVGLGTPIPTPGNIDFIQANEANDNISPRVDPRTIIPNNIGLASPKPGETTFKFFSSKPSDQNLGINNGAGSPGSGRLEKPAIEELLKRESIKIVELNSKFKIICDLNGRLIKARHRCKMANIDKTSFLAIIEDGIRLHLGRIWDTCNELSQQNSPPQQGQQGILPLDNINTFLLEIEGQLSGNAPSPKI